MMLLNSCLPHGAEYSVYAKLENGGISMVWHNDKAHPAFAVSFFLLVRKKLSILLPSAAMSILSWQISGAVQWHRLYSLQIHEHQCLFISLSPAGQDRSA
jgi:hypothetical protein